MGQTNYLQAEFYQQLQNNDELIEFIEQGSLDGLWYWDLEQPENEWMSPRFWQVLGIDPSTKKHLSSEWQDLIHPDDLKTALHNFEKHCSDSTFPYDQYVRYKHIDGSWVWVRCRGMAIRNKEGKPIRMLGAHTDVTELVDARRQLELAKQLQVTNDDLTILSYAVSHDIKAPLASLSGLIRELQFELQETQSDQIQQMFILVESQLHKMTNLIESVGKLTDLGPQTPLDLTTVNIQDLINQVTSDLQTQNTSPSIIIETTGTKTIYADYDLLLRAMLNIVQNSIKYRRQNCPLKIAINNTANALGNSLSISDNGLGLTQKQSKSAFDYFTKFHPTSINSGSGLGLSIVKRIMQAHAGWANAHANTDTGGLTVELHFPNPSLQPG